MSVTINTAAANNFLISTDINFCWLLLMLIFVVWWLTDSDNFCLILLPILLLVTVANFYCFLMLIIFDVANFSADSVNFLLVGDAQILLLLILLLSGTYWHTDVIKLFYWYWYYCFWFLIFIYIYTRCATVVLVACRACRVIDWLIGY